MPCTGLWFNKPPGIRPCPLYTPPVALTDGLLCEFEGLGTAYMNLFIVCYHLWKLKRTVWSKGKRSRNKASVGEPADGSLRVFFYKNLSRINFLFYAYTLILKLVTGGWFANCPHLLTFYVNHSLHDFMRESNHNIFVTHSRHTVYISYIHTAWAMDLLVPCIVEGRSELRNIGRVNCKTHWSIFSGCGTPYSLNVYIALQIKLCVLTLPAARSVECALICTRILRTYAHIFSYLVGDIYILHA